MVLAISKHGSLRNAAEALSITQPALTRSLKDLEATVGVALFSRTHQGMALTPAGEQFREHAQILLNQFSAAVERLDEHKEGFVGKVTIAMLPAVMPGVIPAVVAKLDALNSGINLTLSAGLSRFNLPRLLNGEIDMIVGRLQPVDMGGLKKIPLFFDGISIGCRPDHPLLENGSLEISQLLDEKWIIPSDEDSLIMQDVHRSFTNLGLRFPADPMEVHSLQAIRGILRGSNRIAILSSSVAEEEKRHGLLGTLPVQFDANHTPIGITMRPDEETSSTAKLVVRHIEEVCAKMYPAAL